MKTSAGYLFIGLVWTATSIGAAAAGCPSTDTCCETEWVTTCPCPPPACVVDACCTPVYVEPIVPAACGSSPAVEQTSGCLDYLPEAPVEAPSAEPASTDVAPATEDLLPEAAAHTPMTEETPAEPESVDVTTSPVELPDDTGSSESTTLPVAPIAVPEPTSSGELAEPTPSTPIENSIVGDRYSNSTTPSPATPAPAEEGTEVYEAADIFGTTPAPAAEVTPAPTAETLPAQPVVEEATNTPAPASTPAPTPTSTSSDEDLDDIFGESEPTPTEPVDEEPAQPEPEVDEDDPFLEFSNDDPRSATTPNILTVAGGLQSKTHRVWTDNTAKFRCDARLLSVNAEHAVLLRSTGKQLTVPFTRLSDGDLDFVRQQVTALRIARTSEPKVEKLALAAGN